MELQRITQHKKTFDEIQQFIKSDDGHDQIEVWFARELQELLGYARWENFVVAISRAVESCKTQGAMSMTIFVTSRKWLLWEVDLGERYWIIC